MGMIFFFILFNYTCLRNVKDALVVTHTGAEALSFLKLFCVMPSAIIFMLMYAGASNILSNEKLFYFTLTPFIVFFGLFAFWIYPNRVMLHPAPETIVALQTAYPSLHWFFAIFGVWSYGMFYVLAEIWGSAILSLSFWQFANQITHMKEAKRMYAFFAIMAQFSLILSGMWGEHFSDIRSTVSSGMDPWQISLNWLMGAVVVCGVLTMLIYRWIYRCVLTDKRFYDKPEMPGVTKKKKKASLIESMKVIFSSPYLGLIVALVVAYGITVNLIEGLWKSQLEVKYPNPNDYNTFMNQYSQWTGYASIVIMIVGSNILRLFRWFTAAVITPLVFLVGGILFFTFILFRTELGNIIAGFGSNPVTIAVFLGVTVLVIAKSTKYALFDLTKEMAYIPLDEEMKVKGKAVVDVVGGRLGKSGGAGFQVFLFQLGGWILSAKVTYTQIAPYAFGCFLVITVIWIVAVKSLSKRVDAASQVAGE